MKVFEIEAIVEIPHGSAYKYEVDKKTGRLTVDRPLPSPLPYNYGYVPNTLSRDGDPLDICIIGCNPIQPLASANVVILGALVCNDNGDSDDKLLGMIVKENLSTMLIEHHIGQVQSYLSCYKSGFVVEKRVTSEEAYEILMRDTYAYQNE